MNTGKFLPSNDWHIKDRYQAIGKMDRAGLGWEFLRRNPRYTAEAQLMTAGAWKSHENLVLDAVPPPSDSCWALDHLEDPNVHSAHPHIFWRLDIVPSALIVDALPAAWQDDNSFDVVNFLPFAKVLRLADGTERLSLSDGSARILLSVRRGTLLAGPVRFRYVLQGMRDIEAKAVTMQRLIALCRLGRFPRDLFPPERRGQRWAHILQAVDGLRAEASQRDIAEALFGAATVQEDWRGRSDYLRLRVQRLLKAGGRMIDDGYLNLLKRA